MLISSQPKVFIRSWSSARPNPKPCGVFSAWFPGSSVRENLPRLLQYWELFPDRIPERIVVGMEDPAATELLRQGLAGQGWRETPMESGFWLLEH